MKVVYLKSHIDKYFENLSQVLFFKNSYFGFLFLLLSVSFSPQIFLSGFIASLIGYIYSEKYPTPKLLKQSGLMTINGFFFGIALASLFYRTQQFYFFFVIGILAIPLLTKALFEVLQHWKLSPFIGPYIIAVWMVWLCADPTMIQPYMAVPSSDFVLSSMVQSYDVWYKLIRSTFYSVGQLFFFQNANYGLALAILVLAFSPRKALYFILGTALATFCFYGINQNSGIWEYGYYAFSAGLVGLGLASRPEKFSGRLILFFCGLSVFVTLALSIFLDKLSLPILSLPYVMTFWFALLSRAPRLNVNWAPAELA